MERKTGQYCQTFYENENYSHKTLMKHYNVVGMNFSSAIKTEPRLND